MINVLQLTLGLGQPFQSHYLYGQIENGCQVKKIKV